MSKGEDFEKLVTMLERMLNDRHDVELLHNVKIPTRYGGKRQIDILLKIKSDRFVINTIIECKDTSKKVSVNSIGAFKELVQSVGAHQGIIVSKSGFQSGAFLSAKEANILLYEFSEIKELGHYLQNQTIFFYELTHTSKEIVVDFMKKKDINKEITVNSELFFPLMNKKMSIFEIENDFLLKMRDVIIGNLMSKIGLPKAIQKVKGSSKIKINFTSPLIFVSQNDFTEIVGFEAKIESDMFVSPSEVKNVSEYKNALTNEVYASVYDVVWNGKSYKFFLK